MSDKAAAAPAPDKANGSKSKLPMIIAAVVLLAGGGGGYYWYSQQQAAAEAEADEADEADDEDVDDGHATADDGHGTTDKNKNKKKTKKKKKKAGDEEHHSRLMAFEPFVVNLADPGVARFLRTNVQLVVSGGEEAGGHGGAKGPTVEEMRLRSAILELLSAETSDRLTTPDGKTALKDHILERSAQVLEGAHIEVEDVLFSDFVIQY